MHSTYTVEAARVHVLICYRLDICVVVYWDIYLYTKNDTVEVEKTISVTRFRWTYDKMGCV